MFGFSKNKLIYADYASATPLDKEVFDAMHPYLGSENFGNPASIHSLGRRAREIVNESREKIARILQVKSDEIIFTGNGTEANNLAIIGVTKALKNSPTIVTSKIEHSSVLEPIRYLEGQGTHAVYLSPDAKGQVSEKELISALEGKGGLVSIALSNGEIGTVEKIRFLGNAIHEHKRLSKDGGPVYFHTDASQAVCFSRILPNDLSVDLLTIDASKIYGPKGVGLLFVKRGTPLTPLMRGGGQERGLRPGTENVAGIVGLAKAIEIAERVRDKESKRILVLRDSLRERLLSALPGSKINGEGDPSRQGRAEADILPNFLNICIPGIDAEFLSVRLDREGVAVSSASACRSISGSGSSYVIESLPGRVDCGKSSLRISLGRETRESDIKRIEEVLVRLVKTKQ